MSAGRLEVFWGAVPPDDVGVAFEAMLHELGPVATAARCTVFLVVWDEARRTKVDEPLAVGYDREADVLRIALDPSWTQWSRELQRHYLLKVLIREQLRAAFLTPRAVAFNLLEALGQLSAHDERWWADQEEQMIKHIASSTERSLRLNSAQDAAEVPT